MVPFSVEDTDAQRQLTAVTQGTGKVLGILVPASEVSPLRPHPLALVLPSGETHTGWILPLDTKTPTCGDPYSFLNLNFFLCKCPFIHLGFALITKAGH